MLICILNDPLSQRNVVICGYSKYKLMWCLRQEELLHLSIHNLYVLAGLLVIL